VGNPLLWATTTLVVGGTLGAVVWFGVRQVMNAGEKFSTYGRALEGSLPLLLGYVGFLLPWVLTRRDPYIYHYLPAYALGVILVGGWLDVVLTLWRRRGLFFLAGITAVSGYFAPVWAPLPLRSAGVEARLFMEGWRK
jgi:dolichyl-phosphate-mannose--protein O-mannosyl transferase